MAGRTIVTVTYRERDRAWRVRWREHGQRKERTYYDADEAQGEAEAIERRIRFGLSGTRASRTVGQLVGYWLNGYVQSLEVATRDEYLRDAKYVVESLGTADAHSLTTASVRAWHTEAAQALASPRRANKALTALSSAYQRAIEHDPPLVEVNPCRGVKRHPEPRRAIVVPTRTQVDWLERTAPTLRERVMLLLAAKTGPRQGELLGLEWANVLPDGVFYDQVSDRKRSIRRHTKTRSSRRVPAPRSVLDALATYRPPGASGLLFPGMDPARPLDRGGWSKTWKKWRLRAAWEAAEAGESETVWGGLVVMEWKNLRHHYASRLAAAGASMLQCSRWMGHSSIKTTDTNYWFLYDEDEAAVMAALDA